MASPRFPAGNVVVPIFTFDGKEITDGAVVRNEGSPSIVIGPSNDLGAVPVKLLQPDPTLLGSGEERIEQGILVFHEDRTYRLEQSEIPAGESTHAFIVCAPGKGEISAATDKGGDPRGTLLQRSHRNGQHHVVTLARGAKMLYTQGNKRFTIHFDGDRVTMRPSKRGRR